MDYALYESFDMRICLMAVGHLENVFENVITITRLLFSYSYVYVDYNQSQDTSICSGISYMSACSL